MDTATIASTLWSVEDIAGYYGRSVRTARRLIREAGFPPPARGDRHRWVASQVIAFAESGAVEQVEVSASILRPTGGSGRIERPSRKAAA